MITSLSNRQHVNEFTLGKEAMIHTFTGKKFKVTIHADGPTKLIGKMQHIRTVTELKGDKLISVSQMKTLSKLRPLAG
ncbi:gastrotropin-like [Callorhinchus milii]|uniref:gastrotropin-like n=1 Tax=Callorhinchus milii TaxID=7868 RepID=UPI001C3FAD79|nr:gastrotropin-like [Callorhinchus milii]